MPNDLLKFSIIFHLLFVYSFTTIVVGDGYQTTLAYSISIEVEASGRCPATFSSSVLAIQPFVNPRSFVYQLSQTCPSRFSVNQKSCDCQQPCRDSRFYNVQTVVSYEFYELLYFVQQEDGTFYFNVDGNYHLMPPPNCCLLFPLDAIGANMVFCGIEFDGFGEAKPIRDDGCLNYTPTFPPPTAPSPLVSAFDEMYSVCVQRENDVGSSISYFTFVSSLNDGFDYTVNLNQGQPFVVNDESCGNLDACTNKFACKSRVYDIAIDNYSFLGFMEKWNGTMFFVYDQDGVLHMDKPDIWCMRQDPCLTIHLCGDEFNTNVRICPSCSMFYYAIDCTYDSKTSFCPSHTFPPSTATSLKPTTTTMTTTVATTTTTAATTTAIKTTEKTTSAEVTKSTYRVSPSTTYSTMKPTEAASTSTSHAATITTSHPTTNIVTPTSSVIVSSTTHTPVTSTQPTPEEKFTTSTTTTTSVFEGRLPLLNISDIPVTTENVVLILNLTLYYSDEGRSLDNEDVLLISNILENCSKIEYLQKEATDLFLLNLDYILNAHHSRFEGLISERDNPAKRVLDSLPRVAVKSIGNVDYNGKNLGLFGKTIDCSSEAEDVGMKDDGSQFRYDSDAVDASDVAAIEIPQKSLCNSDATHAMVTIFRDRKLFVGTRQYHTIKQKRTPIANFEIDDHHANIRSSLQDVNPSTEQPVEKTSHCKRQKYLQDQGRVLTGTAIDGKDKMDIRMISRVTDGNGQQMTMSRIKIDVSQNLRPLHGKYAVSWWDTELLEWAEHNECSITEKGGFVHAECNHLTDFTLLIDGMIKDPCVCDRPLIVIGYVANSISIICLFTLVLIMGAVYSLRLRNTQFVKYITGSAGLHRKNTLALVYNFTLFLFYLIFTAFSDKDTAGNACEVFGAISYCLFMSCMLLTIFQALRTAKLFYSEQEIIGNILSFTGHLSVVVSISFGAPVILAICLYTMTNFFLRQDGFCWVRGDYVMFAIVIPLSLLVINAAVCTGLIAAKLFYTGHSSRVPLRRRHIRQRVVTILLMQITLGMPWILQYLAIFSPNITAWHYLFTIVNGSQGVMVFLLWLYRRYRQSVTGRDKRALRVGTEQTTLNDDSD